MKILSLLLFISFGSVACMTGHWESVGKSSSFTIDLVQHGEHVSGKYCFITNNGNRIDCAEQDDEDNITGDIKNGVAKVVFESTFGRSGVAIAEMVSDKLIYKVEDKKPFVEANMSVPDEIKLIKK
jgi:hypothetical protein